MIIILIGIVFYFFIRDIYFKCKKQRKNDELYMRKIKYLRKKQYDYYYTMAINSPETLCDFLAEKDMERIIQRNLVVGLYTKLRHL